MTLQENVYSTILQPESETLEYKAVLPPSKSIAQIICSFANTKGGILILGVSEIAGLKILDIFGSYDLQPYKEEESNRLIIVACK